MLFPHLEVFSGEIASDVFLNDRRALDFFQNFSQVFRVENLLHTLNFPRSSIAYEAFILDKREKLNEKTRSGVLVRVHHILAR